MPPSAPRAKRTAAAVYGACRPAASGRPSGVPIARGRGTAPPGCRGARPRGVRIIPGGGRGARPAAHGRIRLVPRLVGGVHAVGLAAGDGHGLDQCRPGSRRCEPTGCGGGRRWFLRVGWPVAVDVTVLGRVVDNARTRHRRAMALRRHTGLRGGRLSWPMGSRDAMGGAALSGHGGTRHGPSRQQG